MSMLSDVVFVLTNAKNVLYFCMLVNEIGLDPGPALIKQYSARTRKLDALVQGTGTLQQFPEVICF